MRLLDYNPLTGISQYFEYDSDTDEMTIHSRADAGPTLELNKILANDAQYSRDGIKNEMWHVASIPPIVQLKWLHEKGIDVFNKDHWPAVKRLLEDPEYRYLKTTAGRI